jgi:biofilm protein TabA
MICDRLTNAPLYAGLGARIGRALDAVSNPALQSRPDGRYDIDGDRLFCLVQRYTTRTADKCNLESHRKYIDVQLIVTGEEDILHANPDGLVVRQVYEPGGDKALYHPVDGMTRLRLRGGEFAVFFPHDAHMPCLQAGGPCQVHKLVAKVLIEEP